MSHKFRVKIGIFVPAYVLLGIFAILLCITYISSISVKEKLREECTRNHLEKLMEKVEKFKKDVGVYPVRLEDLYKNTKNYLQWKGPYIKKKEMYDIYGNRILLLKKGKNILIVSPGKNGRIDIFGKGGMVKTDDIVIRKNVKK